MKWRHMRPWRSIYFPAGDSDQTWAGKQARAKVARSGSGRFQGQRRRRHVKVVGHSSSRTEQYAVERHWKWSSKTIPGGAPSAVARGP